MAKSLDDHLDDLVDAWHDSGPEEKRGLHEYLGMTWEEYKNWTESCIVPQTFLDRHPELM